MLGLTAASVDAQAPDAPLDSVSQAAGSPGGAVVFEGDTLFIIEVPLGPFSAADRAAAVVGRLGRAIADPLAVTDTVYSLPAEGATDIVFAGTVLASVTDADAAAAGISRDSLTALRVAVFTATLERRSAGSIVRAVSVGLSFTAISLAVFALIAFGLGRVFPVLQAKLESWRATRIPAIRIQRLEIVSSHRFTDGLILAAKTAHVVMLVLLVFYLVPLVLGFFPWTAPLADSVFDWVRTPLRAVWIGFVDYLPNLFAVSVIAAVLYGLNRFIHLIFRGLETGAVRIGGFYREWADPTYKIVRFVVIAFAAIMIWPYLPGSDSAAFQGISVFLGILISFGSAGAVANIVAGVVMTYMRPFMIGDRVRIADTLGDVTRRTLLITRVRTSKNVDVTIPNAMVLSSHIINYSATAKHQGLILHTTVTLGYDAPWRNVHEALVEAARRTEGILAEPAPFVLQTALNDFHVSYELNAYTDRPNEMASLYSRLHQSMQDACNEAGIEILSPAYSALRDGSHSTMPADYLPKGYRAPGWGFGLR
jgi:small-conductance mechanosensitive channel